MHCFKRKSISRYQWGWAHYPIGIKHSRQSLSSIQASYFSSTPIFKHTHPSFLNKPDILASYKTIIADKLQPLFNVDYNHLCSSLHKPNKLQDGDLILPLPKLGLHQSHSSELQHYCEIITRDNNFFEKIVIKGNFLQFFFNHDLLLNKTINDILISGSDYGKTDCDTPKSILVEFSSPNIAKPFHAGHLRSTIIGEFLSNLYETFGWKVIRMNYLGDWGKQFGIMAVGYEKFGDPKELENDPINHLFKVYVRTNTLIEDEIKKNGNNQSDTRIKAQKFFRRLEEGDVEALALWKHLRNISIDKYIKTYSKLGIQFDVYSGESEVKKQSIFNTLKQLKEIGLTQDNHGATEIDLTPYNKKLGKIIVEKSDNTSLYITRDICACIDRHQKYDFDKMIYVVACQQDLYMNQFFEILKQMKLTWVDKLEHISFGMVKGMSTRKGNVVFLDTIIAETTKQMLTVLQYKKQLTVPESEMREIAEKLGLSAILIQDMKSKRVNNYTFDWKRMLSFEGNTGPYLQYTHSRLCAIQSKCEDIISLDDCKKANLSILKKPEAINLTRLLSQYHYTLQKTMEDKEPSTLVTYLFTLSHQISTCYNSMWVLGQPKDIATAHLALYLASKQVLANGLQILGIQPIQQM